MNKIQCANRLLLAAMGCVFTLSSWAAITSAPTDTVKGRAPVLASAQVNFTDADSNGLVNVGDTLLAIQNGFTDADGDLQSGSVYSWKANGAEVGTGDTYTLTDSDAGKKITLTIVALTDSSITDPYESLPIAAVGGTADSGNTGGVDVPVNGTVLAVTIDGLVAGFPQVGTPLTAVSTCQGGSCSNLTYQWQIETAIGSGVFVDINGATSVSYTPQGGDQKRKIQVIVDN